jgi:hypothetical protein
MSEVVVELVRQRSQRPPARSARKDLLNHIANQRLRDRLHRKPERRCRRLPGAGQSRIVQRGEMSGYTGLQGLQDRGLLLERNSRHMGVEYLVQHRR